MGREEPRGEGYTHRGHMLLVVLPVTPAVDEVNIHVLLIRHGRASAPRPCFPFLPEVGVPQASQF